MLRTGLLPDYHVKLIMILKVSKGGIHVGMPLTWMKILLSSMLGLDVYGYNRTSNPNNS
jgi:hypothetical protein